MLALLLIVSVFVALVIIAFRLPTPFVAALLVLLLLLWFVGCGARS